MEQPEAGAGGKEWGDEAGWMPRPENRKQRQETAKAKEKEYQAKYYQEVTKPKRQAKKEKSNGKK